MRVSIIIPTWNEAEGISNALAKAWANRPHEVIVADGGSRDETAAIAQGTASRVLVAPRGRAIQQNAGARQATGEVLLFLHADNWLDPDGVRQIMDLLKGNPAVTFGGFRQRIEAPGRIFRLLERGNAYRATRWGVVYGDQGFFIRREMFERCGGFPEVPLMEDVLISRTLRRDSRPALLPGPLHVSARRWQRHGVVRQTLRNWLLLSAFQFGVSPARLAKFYAAHK